MVPENVIKLWEEIEKILKAGNTAEVKKSKGDVIVVEIKRQVKIKKTLTTGYGETANRGYERETVCSLFYISGKEDGCDGA